MPLQAGGISVKETATEACGLKVGSPGNGRKDPYLLESVAHACQILKLFQTRVDGLNLVDVVRSTGLNKTVAFRLLHTLDEFGLVEKCGSRYRSSVRLLGTSRFTIGYAAQASDSAFSAEVSEGLRQAADREGLKLLSVDNKYSAKTALRNAEALIREGVDLAIEFQTFDSVAPLIGARFREAGIPLIAIDIPHAGATYFGADNYQVGATAGRALARWARQNWGGRVDQVLLLEIEAAGALPHLRLTGIVNGIQSVLPTIPAGSFIHLESRGDLACSMERVRRFVKNPKHKRILIGGVNDPCVLGALRAFEEAGRLGDCAAIGLGAIREARSEIRKPGTRLIGSVAFFPEKYGSDLIRLALAILGQRQVPPAIYVEHALVTASNVDHLYPNDKPEIDRLDDLVARGTFR
jgi:ribose transport system substrate-binding protein